MSRGFRTALCDVLGIEYPLLQSGMGTVAGPELVVEVCGAGALGILAGLGVPPDELRRRIRYVRSRTDRPFGVNLWLHAELRPPVAVESVGEETIRRVQGALNTFRDRLEIPTTVGRPPATPDLVDAAIDVILDERVPVLSTGIGMPTAEMVGRCHARGVKVVAMVATVADARTVAGAGADVVVAQGGEAGGHRSVGTKLPAPDAAMIGTMTLVPQVVDAVRVPVVAAGGIADGRGIVAALALGASGALLGTRFVATRESAAAEAWKKSLLEKEADATTVTDAFTGQWARTLKNGFETEYRASGAPVLPSLLQLNAAEDIFTAARKREDREHFPMYAGQAVGLIHDLPGAGEVVLALVREAERVLAALPRQAGGV
jgi:nitronate monooxygenase